MRLRSQNEYAFARDFKPSRRPPPSKPKPKITPAQSQALSYPELLVEILRYLPVKDLNKARKVNRTWHSLTDTTPALRRTRCSQPLAWDESYPATNQKGYGVYASKLQRRFETSFWPRSELLHLPDREHIRPDTEAIPRERWERWLHYVQPIQYHPELQLLYWYTLSWERTNWGLTRDRFNYVTNPPITVLNLGLTLRAGRNDGLSEAFGTIVSTVTLVVKSGIKCGDVRDTLQKMVDADNRYVGRAPTGDNIWSARKKGKEEFHVRAEDFVQVRLGEGWCESEMPKLCPS